MKAVVQRVKRAGVEIDGEIYSEIETGLLILLCIEKGDEEAAIKKFCEKISKVRLFEDESGKMNLSISEISGSILLVSQFTLTADLRKGTRPSFEGAEKPDRAKELIHLALNEFSRLGIPTKSGKFGAMMQVALVNDGPVTLSLDF